MHYLLERLLKQLQSACLALKHVNDNLWNQWMHLAEGSSQAAPYPYDLRQLISAWQWYVGIARIRHVLNCSIWYTYCVLRLQSPLNCNYNGHLVNMGGKIRYNESIVAHQKYHPNLKRDGQKLWSTNRCCGLGANKMFIVGIAVP